MKKVRFKAEAGTIRSVLLPVPVPVPVPGLEPEPAPAPAPELDVAPAPLGHSSASSKGVVAVLASSLQYRWKPPLTII
jgi:hypothetical protein